MGICANVLAQSGWNHLQKRNFIRNTTEGSFFADNWFIVSLLPIVSNSLSLDPPRNFTVLR